MKTRDEHLAWCKERALQILESGDMPGAVASMISDLEKYDKPLYDTKTMTLLSADGIFFRNTPDRVKNWIEGFN